MSILDTIQGAIASVNGSQMQQLEAKVREMGLDPKEIMSKIPTDKLPEVLNLVKTGKWEELKIMLMHLIRK